MALAKKEEVSVSKSLNSSHPSGKRRLSRRVLIIALLIGILCLAQFGELEAFLSTTENATTANRRQHESTTNKLGVVFADFLSFFHNQNIATPWWRVQSFLDHHTYATRNTTMDGSRSGGGVDAIEIVDEMDCISRSCMAHRGMLLARVFPDHSQNTKWHDTQQKSKKNRSRQISTDARKGILLIKIPEAASSDAAAVAIRIARQYNANVLYMPQTCAQRRCHERNREESILLTTIRSPESRSISRVFSYYISALQKGSTDDDIQVFLETNHMQYGSISKGQGGFQLQYTSMDIIEPYSFWNESQPEVVANVESLMNLVQRVVENYDFILVAERFDESLVALSFRLGVLPQDVMYYTTATSSTNSSRGPSYSLLGPRCIKLVDSASRISPVIQQLLDSNRWNAMNYGDYLLHSAANKSLDLTIDAIGHERFKLALQDFQHAKAKIQDKCAANVIFPCSKTGSVQKALARQSCYYNDVGCGYPCIDQVLSGKEPVQPLDSVVEPTSCLSRSCIEQRGMSLSRVFPDYTNNTTWQNTKPDPRVVNKRRGILLVKMPKAASSTSASVAIRIARRYHANVVFKHDTCSNKRFVERSRQKSYLFTTIRSPETRSISRVFYLFVSIYNYTATNGAIRNFLEIDHLQYGSVSAGQGGFQLRYAAMENIEPDSFWNARHPEVVSNMKELVDVVQNTIDNYDFIIVTERLDESLVAMSFRLGLPLQDFIYSSTKETGSYHMHENSKCIKIQKSFVTPVVQKFLDSNQWNAMNYGDYLLHAAANKSLDLTIDAIGRDQFHSALNDFQELKAKVVDHCATETVFPCTSTGTAQNDLAKKNCYHGDIGCGYPCIDKILGSKEPI